MHFKTKVVYTRTLNYASVRNFAGLNIHGYNFKTKFNLLSLLFWPIYTLRRRFRDFYKNSFLAFGFSSQINYHFFNTINFGTGRWVVTFEDTIPRFGLENSFFIRLGLMRLASKNCKALIAFSHNAANRQKFFLSQYPDLLQKIEGKIHVLYPSQPTCELNEAKWESIDLVQFVFVGNAFFTKGGLEILHALSRIKSEGIQFKLHIVSSLQNSGWLEPPNLELCKKEVYKLLSENRDNFIFHGRQSNSFVLDLFNKCHVALLPSFGETFGYAVLEAQSRACPIITTNIWSFEEINNEQKGWIIEIPRIINGGGYIADIDTEEKRKLVSLKIEHEIYRICKGIISDSSVINIKGRLAYADIVEKFNPLSASSRLKDLYDEVFTFV